MKKFVPVLFFAFLAVFLLTGTLQAQEGFLFDAYVKLDKEAEDAIAKAQEKLAKLQQADGSWQYDYGKNTGVNAIAVLALMVNGAVPGEGKYAKEIGNGIQFLLNSQKESGLIASGESESKAPMYQHALSTIALAEVYGMTLNPRLRTALIDAVNLIVETQDGKGGWRYLPRPMEGDISATVMQVMALRAASESGIYVPKETIDRAVSFIKSCYNEKEKGFGYMNGKGEAAFPRSAAGLVCLQAVGLNDDPTIPDVVGYVCENSFKKSESEQHHYWYGHYYASIGLYHYGGEPWKTYYPKIKAKIMGIWREKDYQNGNAISSAWSILILGVPYRYLPIYQR